VIDLVRSPFTLLDGGLSTVLEEMGEHPSGLLWTAAALVDRPWLITEAHGRYVEAGADVVITASYQASVAGLVGAGLEPAAARRALASTTELARASGAALVAASVGPFGACLADGSEYRGTYAADWHDVARFQRERLEVLVDSGPDVFAVETMPGSVEARIVIDELRALTDAPAWVTFTCNGPHTTCTGDAFADAVAVVAPAVQAVGVNCTHPAHVGSLLAAAASVTELPLVAYPNHGAAWDAVSKCWIGSADGTDLPLHLSEWLAAGARLVGGCCGVGTKGIAALAAARARH
jgi:homocysteine S-methyltransferase